jgi:hypothetical protein
MAGEQVVIVEPSTSPVSQDFHCSGKLIVTNSDVVGTIYPPGGGSHGGATIAPDAGFDWTVEFKTSPLGAGMKIEVETVNAPIVGDVITVEIVNGMLSLTSQSYSAAAQQQNVGAAGPSVTIDAPQAAMAVPPKFTARGRVENANRGIRGLVIRPGAPPTAVAGHGTLNGKDWTVAFDGVPAGKGQILRVRTADGRAVAELPIDVVAGAAAP